MHLILVVSIVLNCQAALGKVWKNGGEIRDIKEFIVEAKIVADRRVRVYLLDKNERNPTTDKSDVTASHMVYHEENKMSCRAKEKKYFDCLSKTKLNEGSLFLWVKRNGVQFDSVVVYNLPFSTK